MPEKALEKELDSLKAEMTNLREEIATLETDVKEFAEMKSGASGSKGESFGLEGSAIAEQAKARWAAMKDRFDTVRARGERLAGDLKDNIQEHPVVSTLVGGAVAFSLGLLLARMWGRQK